MTIELRLSDVEPPLPEPKRTIYRDIVNLPSTVKLGMTIRYFNHDDVALYFQITGSGAGYTFGTVNLGQLGAGANAYQNLDEFASRAKPASGDLPNGEMEENVTLTLKAYTDSGYTNLKWTFERTVTVHWINSADAAFTVDFLNNFDDGTVQGWAVANESGNVVGYPTLSVVTDYVLSAPYSIMMRQRSSGVTEARRARLYKSFATPNKDKVFAILDIRATDEYYMGKNLRVQRDSVLLVYIGKPYDTTATRYVPKNKWMRFVVPLPKNTAVEVRVVQENYCAITDDYCGMVWLDDFKIISK